MTLNQLIEIADNVYPDGLIARYWDKKKQRRRRGLLGDGLAGFIVEELYETYDDKADDETQLEVASLAMRTAANELLSVSDAFERAFGEVAENKYGKKVSSHR